MSAENLAWPAILLLGVWHGVNPGMGWLFAVALGMQERERRAIWRALPPLALGHALAVGATLVVALSLGLVVPAAALKWSIAAILVVVGLDRLRRSRHPRYGGMRVNSRELTIWSALMASAHGAGLMVVPFVLGRGAPSHGGGHADHAAMLGAGGSGEVALIATLVHTVGYLLVACLVAAIVYERLGVQILRRLWVNLDLIWGVALIATGVVAPLV